MDQTLMGMVRSKVATLAPVAFLGGTVSGYAFATGAAVSEELALHTAALGIPIGLSCLVGARRGEKIAESQFEGAPIEIAGRTEQYLSRMAREDNRISNWYWVSTVGGVLRGLESAVFAAAGFGVSYAFCCTKYF